MGEAPDWKKLYDRREQYKVGLVPRGGIFITAGTDVQRDRIEVEIVAWGRGKESWSIDYRVFEGDTARLQVWEKLTGLLNETFTRTCFADVLTVGRLGGRFACASRRWIWPATHENAILLAARLRHARTTPEFDALLAPPEPEPEIDAPETPTEPLPEFLPMKPPAPPEPDVTIPEGMLTRPWRHQLAAFLFCLQHFAAGFFGLLLAMGMGTGKSLVACLLFLFLRARRTLIVCPLRVVPVWITQFERHVGMPVIIIALDEDVGSVAKKQELAAEKMKLAQLLGQPFVAVINYDSAWREPFCAWAEKVQWDLVIADEAHRIKSPSGKASLFFKRLRLHATHRIALTGTPMPHGPMDIYAVMRFLEMRIFGPSFSAYRTRYAVMGGYQRRQILPHSPATHVASAGMRCWFRSGVSSRSMGAVGGLNATEYGILTTAEEHLAKGQTVMFLASCSYMLKPLIQVLRSHGIPFHNPYRRTNGFWNPLRLGKPGSTPSRVLALLVGHRSAGDMYRPWTQGDVALWAEWLRSNGVLRRGAKKALQTADLLRDADMAYLDRLFEPGALDAMVDAWEGDRAGLLKWWRGLLTADGQKRAEFPIEIAMRHGAAELTDSPKVVVGTIHSVKGGEADVVYLFPDLSRPGDAQYQQMGPPRDSVVRLFYVGMTRARHTLYVCQPETPRAFAI